LGIAGAIAWLTASVAGGTECAFGQSASGSEIVVRVGFAVMLLGPLVGWVAVPVALRWKRRWLSWPVLAIVIVIAATVIAGASAAKLCS
jgi:hypothetical protein